MPILAAIGSTGYKAMLFLHILAVIVAFAPNFVWPFVAVKLRKADKPAGPAIGELAGGNTLKIHGPALVLAGIFGFGLVGMGEESFEFSDPWITAGMTIWFLMLGVVFGLMLPAEKRAAAGDAGAEKITSMAGGLLHLLLAIELYLMVFQPDF